jgi:hypothetical protein
MNRAVAKFIDPGYCSIARKRVNLSAFLAGAYTTTLYVMVDKVKGSEWNIRQKVVIATLCVINDNRSAIREEARRERIMFINVLK